MTSIDDIALGYCIGLFEGEGSIGTSYEKNRKWIQRRIKIQISMTDKQPLEMFQEFMDAGGITGPYYRENRKPVYCLKIDKFEEVQRVVDQIYGWLSPRRQRQCDEAILRYKEWETLHAKYTVRKGYK